MKRLLLILLIAIPLISKGQQDPLYSQYLFNQAIINPAYTGIHNQTTATFISRHQWLGLDGAPKTNTLNGHSSFFDNKVGLGATFVNDRLGVNSNNEFNFAYAYKVKFERSVLAFGLQAGLTTFKYDYSVLNFEFMNDPAFQPNLDSFTKTNFGTGFFYASELFYFGASIPRMRDISVNDGVISSSRYKRHAYISSGLVFDEFRSFIFKPSFLVRIVDGQRPSFDLNANFLIDKLLWVGILARDLKNYGANIQLNFAENFRIGYSFELPTSSLITSSFGTHEFMIGVELGEIRKRRDNIRYY